MNRQVLWIVITLCVVAVVSLSGPARAEDQYGPPAVAGDRSAELAQPSNGTTARIQRADVGTAYIANAYIQMASQASARVAARPAVGAGVDRTARARAARALATAQAADKKLESFKRRVAETYLSREEANATYLNKDEAVATYATIEGVKNTFDVVTKRLDRHARSLQTSLTLGICALVLAVVAILAALFAMSQIRAIVRILGPGRVVGRGAMRRHEAEGGEPGEGGGGEAEEVIRVRVPGEQESPPAGDILG